MRVRMNVLLVASFLAGLACASTRSDSDGDFASRNVLTLEQINSVRASNAYEVVERLKSQWLRIRGTSQMPAAAGSPQFEENPVLVYMDDQRLGTVDQLRRIEIAVVQYIRYYSPSEASARWGFNHGGGVIFVSTRPLES
jgi:hypothetical protein